MHIPREISVYLGSTHARSTTGGPHPAFSQSMGTKAWLLRAPRMRRFWGEKSPWTSALGRVMTYSFTFPQPLATSSQTRIPVCKAVCPSLSILDDELDDDSRRSSNFPRAEITRSRNWREPLSGSSGCQFDWREVMCKTPRNLPARARYSSPTCGGPGTSSRNSHARASSSSYVVP